MSADPMLSVVTPVSRMAGRLNLLRVWLKEIENYPIEVILIHDEQDNETGIELREICSKLDLPRVRLLEQFCGNPGTARNLGLEIAAGEWICFWDSDDFPCVSNFVKMIRDCREDAISICVGAYISNFDVESGLSSTLCSTLASAPTMEALAFNPGIWRMAFRREVLEGVRFHAIRMGEDQLFLANLRLFWQSISFSKQCVYVYNQGSPNQLTSQNTNIKDLLVAIPDVCSIALQADPQERKLLSLVVSRLISTCLIRGPIKVKLRCLTLMIRLTLSDVKLIPFFLSGFVLMLLARREFKR